MKGKIPTDFIDHILAITDIVDIISKSVPIKKKGNSYTACCPFHNEKTPSFHVSQKKQIYHCFGCGVSGNVITFLREYENMNFVEAIEELALLQTLSVPRENLVDTEGNDFSQIYAALNDAYKIYRWQLSHHQNSEQVINYIQSRCLNGETVKEYGIGYAPEQWQMLTDLLKDKYSKEVLVDAGISIKNDNGNFYDRFRDRLVFPIRNRSGQVIGFGGRILKAAENQPKYLNSPETKVFHKGSELYGLYEIKKQRVKLDFLLVVEGYMDVVGLAEYGFKKAVATLGTSLSLQHIKRLFRETNKLIFCFDGDQAGEQAAQRSLELILPLLNEAKEVFFITLEQGEDPDSLIQKIGKAGFEDLLITATPIVDYFINSLVKDKDMRSSDALARMVDQARKILFQIPENSYKVTIKNKLANLANLTQTQLENLFNEKSAQNITKQKKLVNKTNIKSFKLNSERLNYVEKALLYVLQYPELIYNVDLFFPYENEISIFSLLYLLLAAIKKAKANQVNSAILIKHLSELFPEQQAYIYALTALDLDLDLDLLNSDLELESNFIKTEIIESLAWIAKEFEANQLAELTEKSRKYPLNEEETNLMRELLCKRQNK